MLNIRLVRFYPFFVTITLRDFHTKLYTPKAFNMLSGHDYTTIQHKHVSTLNIHNQTKKNQTFRSIIIIKHFSISDHFVTYCWKSISNVCECELNLSFNQKYVKILYNIRSRYNVLNYLNEKFDMLLGLFALKHFKLYVSLSM